MTATTDRGFTLIELLIVVAIISIIASIAVPGLLQARLTANETAAISTLKTVTSAQVAYSASCGQGGHATSFVVLGTPAPGTADGFISKDLGASLSPKKTGYQYTLVAGAGAVAGPNDCNGSASQTAYYATATPLTFGGTGTRSFATNSGVVIWQLNAAAAPTEPFGAPAKPIQ